MNNYEKKHVERIINEIKQIENTKKMTDVEKAYYLYRNLGDIYQYKADYRKTEVGIELDKKLELYREGTSEQGEAICIDMSKTYLEALQMIGIEGRLSSVNENFFLTHTDVCFKDEQGNWYFANLVLDIMHIKTGMKIRNFGLSQEQILKKYKNVNYLLKMNKENDWKEFTPIPEEQLHEWDNETGYTYNGLYTNDILDMLANEMTDKKIINEYFGTDKQDELVQKKLDFIFDKIEIVNVHRKKVIGDIEAEDYYNKILKKFFTEQELKKYIKEFNGFYEKDGRKFARNILVVKKDSENIYYLYSTEKQIYEKISREQLMKKDIRFNIWHAGADNIKEVIDKVEKAREDGIEEEK